LSYNSIVLDPLKYVPPVVNVSPVIVTPLTTKLPPEMVSPVIVSIVAVYPEPLSNVISNVLSLSK
jgi:hypothetical protein